MFAKRQISTAYTLVSVIAVTLSLGFDKNWFANILANQFLSKPKESVTAITETRVYAVLI